MPLGIHAIHPVTGDRVPIWVANFVLMSYGTGAVMSVPAHDQRDWEFARRYGLRIHPVVQPLDGSLPDIETGAFTEHGRLITQGDSTASSSRRRSTPTPSSLRRRARASAA